jgi:hypothetical protein
MALIKFVCGLLQNPLNIQLLGDKRFYTYNTNKIAVVAKKKREELVRQRLCAKKRKTNISR